MKHLILSFLLFFYHSMMGQYTDVINAIRPGFSESPFSVGTGVYQVESSIFYQKSDEIMPNALQKSMGTDVLLRTGLLSEKLEFSLNLKYQKEEYINLIEPEQFSEIKGLSRFTIGAKYMIYMPEYKDPSKEIRSWKRKTAFDTKRFIPSVGIYAGLNTNVLSDEYKLSAMSPRVAILLQNDFNDYTIWVNNILVDYFNVEENRTYGYISTLSYSFTDRFSMFAEHQGMFMPLENEFKLGGGMAYLLGRNLQLGLNVHWDMKTDYLNLYGATSISWRLDRHVEKVTFKKPNNTGSGRIQDKNAGFFQNIFKRKNTRR